MKARAYPITWTASGELVTNPINLYYTTDRGTNWVLIASNQPNTGVYNWTVPNHQTADGMIKIVVTDKDGETASDTSDMSFAIDPPPPVHFTLAGPMTGTVWGTGDHSIDWSLGTNGADLALKVDIALSLDGGTTWNTIASSIDNSGSHRINIAPDSYNSKDAMVRLSSRDSDDQLVSVTSGLFTIDSSAPQVELTTMPAATTGTPLRFEATVQDALGAPQVTLWYRMKGEDYKSTPMHLTGTSLYAAEVPAQTVSGTMEYYLEASDGANTRTTEIQQVTVSTKAVSQKNNGIPMSSVMWLLAGLVAVLGVSVLIMGIRISSLNERARRIARKKKRQMRRKSKRHE